LARSALHAHFERSDNVHLGRWPSSLLHATYRQDQWEALLAAAADRDTWMVRQEAVRPEPFPPVLERRNPGGVPDLGHKPESLQNPSPPLNLLGMN
jgi:hypothetical protein